MEGFIKVAAAAPQVVLANPHVNAERIAETCRNLEKEGVRIAVFPEMCVTGYTCADLFHNSTLLVDALNSLLWLEKESEKWPDLLFAVGLPFSHENTIYNVAAVINNGKILGLIPKTFLPNYNEFYEKRWWAAAPNHDISLSLPGHDCTVLLSARQIFSFNDVKIGVEICEDLWTTIPPSCNASLAGAEVTLNLSASPTLLGKYEYLRALVASQSARCIGAYVYASAGNGESSTDLVFDGTAIIAENGRLLCESQRWTNGAKFITADIDIEAIRYDRRRMTSFNDCAATNSAGSRQYTQVNAEAKNETISNDSFTRFINPLPFVPTSASDMAERCEEIINIQTAGLTQRLRAISCKNAVIGVSGGLDSTLALLVTVRAFQRLGLDLKGIHAITMPGFGTTGRTYRNAVNLICELGVSLREINIADAVNQHFKDIGHNPEVKDVTYENSQARMRTLLLMDIANSVGGIVVGTGDMSELALGWATYNGDHMSMYGVNSSVPKTLVKHLVNHFAKKQYTEDSKLSSILFDIVDTPISPELLPADTQGNITQKTEELVGPYELHDFFLFYTLRYGLSPKSIYNRALIAFRGQYDSVAIKKWLKNFYKRFFSQQFKRSCMPDGPKVGSVCLSPRGDWRMPSDASASAWLGELESL